MTNREPSGNSSGGQFAATRHDEADVQLEEQSTVTETVGGVAAGGGEWWRLANGDLHRVDGPAWQWCGGVEAGGGEEWRLAGTKHRVDGPAVQIAGGVPLGGHEYWYRHGLQHRDPEDGPAVQTFGGPQSGGRSEYWVSGKKVPAPE